MLQLTFDRTCELSLFIPLLLDLYYIHFIMSFKTYNFGRANKIVLFKNKIKITLFLKIVIVSIPDLCNLTYFQ